MEIFVTKKELIMSRFDRVRAILSLTRLISIVSKPILIVVVVVDIYVVFLQNMLGPKKICLKKIHVPKNFRQNIFGSTTTVTADKMLPRQMLTGQISP